MYVEHNGNRLDAPIMTTRRGPQMMTSTVVLDVIAGPTVFRVTLSLFEALALASDLILAVNR